MPKRMRARGRTFEIRPPEGKQFPPCSRCFMVPTVAVLREANTASMMKAKILGMEIPKMTIVLRPCDHSFPYETEEDAANILGMELDGE